MKIYQIKKYSKAFVLSMTLGAMFVSCNSFIDDLEPIAQDSDNYFNSEEDYDKALIGAYDMLQSTYLNILSIVAASDDIVLGGDPFTYDQPTLQRIDKMGHTPADNNQLRDIWRFMYAAMGRANYILEFKDKTDFDGKDEVLAQAYFLRAYFAFELAKFFGDIPLSVEERDGVLRIKNKRIRIGEQYDVNRVGSIDKVYALIEEDLKEAIALGLPTFTTDASLKYKITETAAQALLGKVYLYHGTFDNSKFSAALTQLNSVINSGFYSLPSTNVFLKSGENGPGSVFEVQYTSVEGAGWGCIQCSEGNYLPQNNAPRDYTGPVYKFGWGFSLPTQQLYDAYADGDQRRDITILEPALTSYSPSRENTGYFSKKYLPTQENEDTRTGSDPLNYDNNYRSIRYSDVLLMAAEAAAQSGGANSISYLNQVRNRAFGNNSHDYPYNGESDLVVAIANERRLEFAGEGHRFFDLVRTGKAKIAFDSYNSTRPNPTSETEINFTENKNEVFPIPLVELELANAVGTWGQNQGY
tara:strand:+ start:3416 stop:4996 length:1581 start_codon:yes stop_codon:yes gene_type:complete